jgi:hypothetical protein
VALAGALDQIAAQGGGVVEGYPHEIDEKRMSNSFVYNGTRTMYEQAGFAFVRSRGRRTPSCAARSGRPEPAHRSWVAAQVGSPDFTVADGGAGVALRWKASRLPGRDALRNGDGCTDLCF